MAEVSVICVGGDGWAETKSSLLQEMQTSAWAFHKPWWLGVRFFHRDGRCYEVSSAVPARPLPPLSRLLAKTVYNPRITVRYDYRVRCEYALSDLQQALIVAVEMDNDVLTQFHDEEELKQRLRQAHTFDDFVDVLRLCETETA